MRSIAGCLLLALVAVCASQIALSSEIFHVPIRHQWRAHSQERAAPRLQDRHAAAVPGNGPETQTPTPAEVVAVAPPRDLLHPYPASVFVPPRA